MELGRESSTACVGSVHKRTEASRILLIHRRRSDASSVVVPFCAPLLQQKLLQKKDEREKAAIRVVLLRFCTTTTVVAPSPMIPIAYHPSCSNCFSSLQADKPELTMSLRGAFYGITRYTLPAVIQPAVVELTHPPQGAIAVFTLIKMRISIFPSQTKVCHFSVTLITLPP